MKNKKKIGLAALLGIILCVGLATTLAYFTDSKTQENTITMGKVSIELREPEFEKNEDNHILNIIPNKPITKDPTVSVGADSSDAYIRLNISYEGLDAKQIAELKQGIQLKSGWKMVGNYIYYNQIAKANDVLVAFDTIVIPDWGNEEADLTFKMNIKAEAVQADYFDPTKEDGYIIDWPGVSFK